MKRYGIVSFPNNPLVLMAAGAVSAILLFETESQNGIILFLKGMAELIMTVVLNVILSIWVTLFYYTDADTTDVRVTAFIMTIIAVLFIRFALVYFKNHKGMGLKGQKINCP